MAEYPRKEYLQKLLRKKDNGRVKIITRLRRSGKSYLLFELFVKYLLNTGTEEDQIIRIALDELPNAKYRNPIELDRFIRESIADRNRRYPWKDENGIRYIGVEQFLMDQTIVSADY